MRFEIIGDITQVETVAAGQKIRERKWLWRTFGRGHWKKLKGLAWIRFGDGTIRRAEIHGYEAHGIGKKKFKIKRIVQT